MSSMPKSQSNSGLDAMTLCRGVLDRDSTEGSVSEPRIPIFGEGSTGMGALLSRLSIGSSGATHPSIFTVATAQILNALKIASVDMGAGIW